MLGWYKHIYLDFQVAHVLYSTNDLVGLILGHRLRRCPNSKAPLYNASCSHGLNRHETLPQCWIDVDPQSKMRSKMNPPSGACRIQLTLSEAVEFAEERSQYPSFSEVIHQMHPGAGECDQQVRNGEVHDVEVSGSPHPLVAPYRDNNSDVTQQRHQDQGYVKRRLDTHLPRRFRDDRYRICVVAHVLVQGVMVDIRHFRSRVISNDVITWMTFTCAIQKDNRVVK